MTRNMISQLQYFRLTMSNHMFHGNPDDHNSLRSISKEDYAKIKTIILSAAIIEELPAMGKGFYHIGTSKGSGELLVQCKNGYVFIRQLTWKG